MARKHPTSKDKVYIEVYSEIAMYSEGDISADHALQTRVDNLLL